MSELLLSAEGLELWRGERRLFAGLDAALGAGATLAVRGPNGSGKTSLLRVLCGLSLADAGTVRWCGAPIAAVRDDYYAALSYLGHRNGLNGELSARDNLAAALRLRRPEALGEIEAMLERLELGGVVHLPVRRLSAGQQRRAAFARILLEAAPLWVLDEPTANLDSGGSALVDGLIDAHTGGGGLAVVATHRPLLGPRVTTLELAR